MTLGVCSAASVDLVDVIIDLVSFLTGPQPNSGCHADLEERAV